jgi:F-type H+-transporting ATPase subunit c
MKVLQLIGLVVFVLLAIADPAMAQTTTQGATVGGGLVSLGAGLGAGVTIIGASIGLGMIGSSALQSMARQPEIAGQIQGAMIVIAALLEGATFFALIICILVSFKTAL